MNENEKLRKELIDYAVNYDILQKEEMSKDELENYRKIKEKIRSLIERLEKNQSSIKVVREEFEEIK